MRHDQQPNQRFEAKAAILSVSIGCGDRTVASVPHPRRSAEILYEYFSTRL